MKFFVFEQILSCLFYNFVLFVTGGVGISQRRQVHSRPRATSSLSRRLVLRLEILQEPPSPFLLPALLAPPIRRLREEVNHVVQTDVVRDIDEDAIVGVELVHLLDTLLSRFRIVVHALARGDEEGLRGRLLRMDCFEDGTRTDRRILAEWRREWTWGDVLRQRQVLCRTELAAVVRDIAAHEDELGRVGAGACEAAHVPDGVAGGVEEVEAAVAVEVEGVVLADF